MTLALLISLLAAPVWRGLERVPPTPATVTGVETALTLDFSAPQAFTANPATSVSRGEEDGNGLLRLEAGLREPATLWLPLPQQVRGRHVRLTARVRSEGAESSLLLAVVEGSRPPTMAPEEGRWSLALGPSWGSVRLDRRFPALGDHLAIRLPAGAPPAQLDDLAIAVEQRLEDATLEALAARRGNLILNGGFEAGALGFKATTTHPSLAADHPPLPVTLRVSDHSPHQGQRAAQVAVVDGPVSVTVPPVALSPGTKYTFSLSARARATGTTRLRLQLTRADGLVAGRKEVVLPADWGRLSTTIETPKSGSRLWLPEVLAYPGSGPYTVDLDALMLADGAGTVYEASPSPWLAIDDGLDQPLGLGHLAVAGEPLTIKARVFAGKSALTGELRTTLESHLGTHLTPLPTMTIAADAEVEVGAILSREPLGPGWYRIRAELHANGATIASDEQLLGVVPAPRPNDWRLALDWTTPDVLLRGRARLLVLEQLPRFGVTSRWLSDNAAAFWAALEPTPGQLRPDLLRVMIESGAEAGLDTVVELDPRPLPEAVPSWVAGQATRGPDGRLIPPAGTYEAFVAALAKALGGKPIEWAVSTTDQAERTRLLKAVGSDEGTLTFGETWVRLPEAPAGPFETNLLELSDTSSGADPWAASAEVVAAMAGGAARGSRAFLWPNQGWTPVRHGHYVQAGLTNPDGGPRPFVAAFATLRHHVGSLPLTRHATRDGVALALFGSEAPVAMLWTTGAPCVVTIDFTPKAYLATGEEVALPEAEGGRAVHLSRWPLYLHLTADEAARLAAGWQ